MNLAETIALSHTLLRIAGVPSYDELRARSTDAEVLGVKVAVCSIEEDLKAMKQAAGRTRDLADLEDLDTAGVQIHDEPPNPDGPAG